MAIDVLDKITQDMGEPLLHDTKHLTSVDPAVSLLFVEFGVPTHHMLLKGSPFEWDPWCAASYVHTTLLLPTDSCDIVLRQPLRPRSYVSCSKGGALVLNRQDTMLYYVKADQTMWLVTFRGQAGRW